MILLLVKLVWLLLFSGKQATDSNAAAWAAYYAQLYGQGGAAGQQPQAQQPQQQQQPAVGAYGTPASSAPTAQPQPSQCHTAFANIGDTLALAAFWTT